jgi:predicted metal-dependent hydrolase
MKKEIILQNKAIGYIIHKSQRARRMRLAVYCDGSVVVVLPYNFQETAAETFIRQKTKWLISKINFFRQFKNLPIARWGRRDYLKRKDEAYSLAEEKVVHFNHSYGFKFNKINIKNQKTRWGSCSRSGNLNFNFKILFLPEKLQDYIIVHELCHLKEFNHSGRFWSLVAKTFPQWPEIKKELRHGALNLSG